MGAFTEKGLQALNQAWVTAESQKYDAERRAGIAEATGDQFALAEAYQDYANAEANQTNLYNGYVKAEQAAVQRQNVPQPMSEGEELQRHIWHTAVEVQPGQVANADAWNKHLTHRWKVGEAVARGQITNEQAEKMASNHVPGRTRSRQGYRW